MLQMEMITALNQKDVLERDYLNHLISKNYFLYLLDLNNLNQNQDQVCMHESNNWHHHELTMDEVLKSCNQFFLLLKIKKTNLGK